MSEFYAHRFLMADNLLEIKDLDKNKDNVIRLNELTDFVNRPKEEMDMRQIAEACKNAMKDKEATLSLDKTIKHAYSSIKAKIDNNAEISSTDVKILKLYLYTFKGVDMEIGDFDDGRSKECAQQFPKFKNYKKDIIAIKSKQIPLIIDMGSAYLQFLQTAGKGKERDLLVGVVQTKLQELQKLFQSGNAEQIYAYNIHDALNAIFDSNVDMRGNGVVKDYKEDEILEKIKQIISSGTKAQRHDKKYLAEKKIDTLLLMRKIDKESTFLYHGGEAIFESLGMDLASCSVSKDLDFKGGLNTSMKNISAITVIDANGNFSPLMDELMKALESGKINTTTTYTAKEGIPITTTSYDQKSIIDFLAFKGIPGGASNVEARKPRIELSKELIKELNKFKSKEKKEKENMKTAAKLQAAKDWKSAQAEKEKLITEMKVQGIDPTKLDKNNPFNAMILMQLNYLQGQEKGNRDLLATSKMSMEIQGGGTKEIALDDIINEQYDMKKKIFMAEAFRKIAGYYTLEANEQTIENLRGAKKKGKTLTTDEKMLDLVSDIKGVGRYFSDTTCNAIVETTQEIITQVILMAISGGIANVAAKGALLAIERGSMVAKFGNAGLKFASRISKYSNMTRYAGAIEKGGFLRTLITVPEVAALDIGIEGAAFHLANTTLSELVVNGAKFDKNFLSRINPFGTYEVEELNEETGEVEKKTKASMMDYFNSMGFMGVMKGFGQIANKITQQLAGGQEKLSALQYSKTFKAQLAANAITLPGEIVSMQGTTAIVSCLFGEKVNLTPASWLQTMEMVIGLRFAHMGTGGFNKVAEWLNEKIQTTGIKNAEKMNLTLKISDVKFGPDGKVTSVTYEFKDEETGKIIDAGVANQKSIQDKINALEANKKEVNDMVKNTIADVQSGKIPSREAILDDEANMDYRTIRQQRALLSKQMYVDIVSDPEIRKIALLFVAQGVSEQLPQEFIDQICKAGTSQKLKERYKVLMDFLQLPAVPEFAIGTDVRTSDELMTKTGKIDQIMECYKQAKTYYGEGTNEFKKNIKERLVSMRKKWLVGTTKNEREMLRERYRMARDIKVMILGAEIIALGKSLPDSPSKEIILPNGIEIDIASNDLNMSNFLNPGLREEREQIKDRVYRVKIGDKYYILKEEKTARHRDTLSLGHRDITSSKEELHIAQDLYEHATVENDNGVSLSWEKPIAAVTYPDGYKFALFEAADINDYIGVNEIQLAIVEHQAQFLQEYNSIKDVMSNQFEESACTFEEFAAAKAAFRKFSVDKIADKKIADLGYRGIDGLQSSYRLLMKNGLLTLDKFYYDFEHYIKDSNPGALEYYAKREAYIQNIKDGLYEFNKWGNLIDKQTKENIDYDIFSGLLKTKREKLAFIAILNNEK